MSEAFTGEIRMFAGSSAPQYWAFCNGSMLSISGNKELFSLIGTTYGGDGQTNFGLPDFRGRVPAHYGQGTGLMEYEMGSQMGSETATLSVDQVPAHYHPLQASLNAAGTENPSNGMVATTAGTFYAEINNDTKAEFWEQAVAETGNNESHTNMMPFLAINFIICLIGTMPPRGKGLLPPLNSGGNN